MSEGSEVVSTSGLVDLLVKSDVIPCEPTKRAAAEMIAALFATIAQETGNGKKVRIHGFGTFQVKHKPAYIGRNPATGEEINVPAKDVLVFKAAASKAAKRSAG